MDGTSFSTQTYPIAGVPTADRLSAASGIAPPTPSAPSAPITAATPACVPDFSSSLSGNYVLDWRDPTTHTLLVQIPMRTALSAITGATAAPATGLVGRHLNETV